MINIISVLSKGIVTYVGFDNNIQTYNGNFETFKTDSFYTYGWADKLVYLDMFKYRKCELKDLRENLSKILPSGDTINNIWMCDVDNMRWYHSRYSDSQFVRIE
jgi:hypothetical protein